MVIFEESISTVNISSKFFESSKIIFYTAFFLSSCFTYAAQDTAHVRTYGGPGKDIGRAIQCTKDSGFIIVGSTASFGSGNTALYIIKTDSMGNHQWSKALGGIGIEQGMAVQQALDGGYVAAGFTNSTGNGGYDVYLVKTDSDGNVVWEKTYGGNDWDFGYGLVQTPDSGFVICGETYSYGNGNADMYFIRTDKNGDTLWTRTAGGDSIDIAYAITSYNDSIYVFTGESNSSGNDRSDMAIGMINKQGITSAIHTFGSTKNDKSSSIQKMSDGKLLIWGQTDSVNTGAPIKNSLLMKVDTSGANIWTQLYGSPNREYIGSMAREKTNGDIIICGTITPGGLGGAAIGLALTNSGGWWQSGDDFGGFDDENGYGFVITPTEQTAFIGSTTSDGQGLEDVYFVKMNSLIQGNYKVLIDQFADILSPLSITDYEQQNTITLTPNPITDNTILEIKNWDEIKSASPQLMIYNSFGQLIYKTTIQSEKTVVEKKSFSQGIYFYAIEIDHQIFYSNKFIAR